ncbi:class I SAM-dependent methyltransferase [Taklimakanibacter lacteus]|uniref:class I SAM-dependent methyltransferase n=1 Tax=Taklimakanibacter lacteus TaxID=2268456 RepID=UPI0013C4DD72
MTSEALKSYPIKGGEVGRARLKVLSGVLSPTTEQHLDRAGDLSGCTVVDVGCGGGDVTFSLARRVGPNGHAAGIDLDQEKIAWARADAKAQDLDHVRFDVVDVTKTWPVKDADLVYARFILTHLHAPAALLDQAMAALKPGGMILVEDIDIAGHFSFPECPAVTAYADFYIALSRRRGGDPLIGRRLGLLLEKAGFDKVETTIVQPFSRQGGAKLVAKLTTEAITEGLLAEGLASPHDIAALSRDLADFSQRPDTIVSMPRIFQAWGRKK